MQPITTLKLKVLCIGCNITAIKVVITAIKGNNITAIKVSNITAIKVVILQIVIKNWSIICKISSEVYNFY